MFLKERLSVAGSQASLALIFFPSFGLFSVATELEYQGLFFKKREHSHSLWGYQSHGEEIRSSD